MVSHMADILRRGIWASLTGGWFYDTSLDLLSNVVHLYIWGSLLVAPFILYMLFIPSEVIWGLYCAVLALAFFVIKFGNHMLHRFFDTHESVGGKHGGHPDDKDASSRGSLESLSEHLAAFSDPDVLADWRKLHPRTRRHDTRNPTTSSANEEGIPLRQLNFASTSTGGGGDSAGPELPPRQRRADSPFPMRNSPPNVEDNQETVRLMSAADEAVEEPSDSPVFLSDRPETINFQAEIHVLQPALDGAAKEIAGSEAVVADEDDDEDASQFADNAPALPEKLAHDTSDSEVYDKFVLNAAGASVAESAHSPAAHHLSVDNIENRSTTKHSKRKRLKTVRRNQLDTSADNSVTSVLHQPTSSMETILSTFKPFPRSSNSSEASTSQQQLPIPEPKAPPSPKGLRRVRSEFYTPTSMQSSETSLEFVKSVSAISPSVVTVDSSSNAKSTGAGDKTHSEPNLENWEHQRRACDDPLGVNRGRDSPETELVAVPDPDIEPPQAPRQRTVLRARRNLLPRERGARDAVSSSDSQRPSTSRQPPFGAFIVPAEEPSHWTTEDETTHIALHPDPESAHRRLLEASSSAQARESAEALSRTERTIRGSILLRRERENRALLRLDPPDPRARLESLTNSRGVMRTLQSWLAGAPPLPSHLTDDVPEGSWPLQLLERPLTSRTSVDEETGLNRYSPQESTVSIENHPTSQSDSSRPFDHHLTHHQRVLLRAPRSRFSGGLTSNPLWQGDDAIQEYPVSSERALAEAAELERRREMWQLLPETSPRPLTPPPSTSRAAVEASLLRAFNSGADDRSESVWEYRLGPKSWKELFSEDSLTRNHPRVRFQRPLYKLSICPWFKQPREINLHLDRLTLTALFDRTRTVLDCVVGIILAVAVGAMGAVLLSRSYVFDLWAFLLCFVMAGCQYSLLKSVQPDAASPTHGFNRIAVYSRAVYFCLIASLILLMDHLATGTGPIKLFGVTIFTASSFMLLRDLLIGVLLCFPVIFAYGLFPQVNTFLTYLLEQLDIHVFGGTGTCGLISALCVLLRNCFAVVALHGICYAAVEEREKKAAKDFNLAFSLFSSLLIASAYHMSRLSTDAAVLWSVMRRIFKKGDCQPWGPDDVDRTRGDSDVVQERIENTVYNRLRSDIIICPIFVVVYFGLHGTTLFGINSGAINLKEVLVGVAVALGFILSYVVPKLRAQMPWLCFSKPLVTSYRPGSSFLLDNTAPRLTVIEKIFVWLRILERNILYPCILLGMLTSDSAVVSQKFGPHLASVLLTIAGLKFLKLAFRDAENQYLVLAFTFLFFRFDFAHRTEGFLLDYWLVSIFYYKLREWLIKWKFVLTYVAPWQITWGSAFHAFAQPFSIPHSGMLLVQTVFSTLISSPLNPFLGSAIFLTSYPRPIKFWEKNYKTRRLDHSNTRLDAQLDGNSGNDDNNLNSIFYEHLTHSLQKSLCGDILMGKWGNVMDGDFFILASDYLNCLVHIVEIGNGLVTFQVRGLEFRGTYCQQREVEAITENVDENRGFCCCEPGHIPQMLSLNAAFSQRWLAWQVYAGRYVVQGYSVSDNNASTMFQIYDLRRVLVTFYIKTIIHYLIRHQKLPQWLTYAEKELTAVHNPEYYDLDTLFMPNIDVDFDFRYHGISRHSFYQTMRGWIEHCVANSEFREMDVSETSSFVTLAFAMSICGRRVLGAAAQLSLHSVDWFLHGLHALFKGDFRINCPRDEWVFVDMDLLHKIVAPAIRMALKLHQDHFTSPEEYERSDALFDAIVGHETNMVICHEGDPKWRNAVLANTPSLLALRHVVDDNRDEYKVIMLNIRNLDFRLIKVNKECVRGFWSGQLQELIYFRNRNPERGSIQNAKQALRNMINSSCDQPIGYPIYVSPLTTSYADTHENLSNAVGGPLTWDAIRNAARETWEDVRDRCYASCSGSSGAEPRVVRPRDPPVVVSYNPQSVRPVEISTTHRSEAQS
ncbi:Pecanex-like protein 1 [Hypsibius exemplaris]|uniref:Pecanex-like protein n=1 Tax=Hypsibius exemplaris TaxID=2072580 RepID=A0A1W0WYH0_HYPEX|nr:Pecanex-like protein 1 [Hypsibius exemplaris]